MTKLRVMFVGQGMSGLPEDRIVNTFHFWDAAAFTDGKLADAMFAVARFYNGTDPVGPYPQNTSIGSYLSPWVNRAAELRGYNLEDAKPRVPTIVPIELEAAVSVAGLPEEVACVASLVGLPPVTRRRRGRIYIGPLCSTAYAPATTAGPSRPHGLFRGDLVGACAKLTTGYLTAPTWCIRSSLPTENFVPIVGGFVDDALDTQRRRGPKTTSRILWIAGT